MTLAGTTDTLVEADAALEAVLPRAEPARPLPPHSTANKLRRALWRLVEATLYRLTPTPLHGPRRAMLRLFGATVGPGAHPYPTATVWAPWNLVMERDSCLAGGVICYNVAPVRLGEGAIVSQHAHLCTASHDFRDPCFTLVAAPIVLEAKAWVTADVFVGPGVKLGEGAVAGARSVVMRRVPAWTVVAGNPARIVGRREMREG